MDEAHASANINITPQRLTRCQGAFMLGCTAVTIVTFNKRIIIYYIVTSRMRKSFRNIDNFFYRFR